MGLSRGRHYLIDRTDMQVRFSHGMSQNLYVLILTGGSGERFWPLSRHSHPKQLTPLFPDHTLLEATVARLSGLVPPERTLVLTNGDQEQTVRRLLPGIPARNIIVEPAKRDTAAAIALGAGLISRRDRSAVVAVLPSDQVIQDVGGFQRTLRASFHAAQATNRIVTVGIRPAWPCPHFGYIELGEPFAVEGMAADAPEVHQVAGFREKPNQELAEMYLRRGGYRWNAGIFVWTIQAMLGALERCVPELAHFLTLLHTSEDCQAVIESRFAALPMISLDYAVMEKTESMLMVEAGFDWDDVGSWAAAARYWERDAAGNAANAAVSALDATDNIVFAEPGVHVALLGVHNLIVIRTKDAVLVCNRNQADRVKELVHKLPPDLQ